jgi:hypothetical protein
VNNDEKRKVKTGLSDYGGGFRRLKKKDETIYMPKQ